MYQVHRWAARRRSCFLSWVVATALCCVNRLIDSLTACFCRKNSCCYQGHFILTRVFIGSHVLCESAGCRRVGMMFCPMQLKMGHRGSREGSVTFSGLSCYTFMTESFRHISRISGLAKGCPAFASCLFPFLHKLADPPSTATLICLSLSANNICCFFFHNALTSIIIISFWAPHRFLSQLCAASHLFFVSLLPTNTSEINLPHCTLSLSIINTFGLRAFMYVFVCCARRATDRANTKAKCLSLCMMVFQKWRESEIGSLMKGRDLEGWNYFMQLWAIRL